MTPSGRDAHPGCAEFGRILHIEFDFASMTERPVSPTACLSGLGAQPSSPESESSEHRRGGEQAKYP